MLLTVFCEEDLSNDDHKTPFMYNILLEPFLLNNYAPYPGFMKLHMGLVVLV